MAQLNIRGVNCEIAQDDSNPGVTRRWTEYGPEVSVRLAVPWASAPDLATALLGTVVLNGDGSLSRVPPYNLPWAPKLYCTGVTEEDTFSFRQDASGWAYFETAHLVATFGALTWQVEGGPEGGQNDPSGLPYTTSRFRVSGQTLQVPKGRYYRGPFGSDAKQLDENGGELGFVTANVELSLTRYYQARLPLADAIGLFGSVNDEPVGFADYTFPRGHLLFVGFGNDPRNDSAGYPVQNLDFSFLGRHASEWNEVLTDEGYQLVNTAQDGSGEFPFAYQSFDALFT